MTSLLQTLHRHRLVSAFRLPLTRGLFVLIASVVLATGSHAQESEPGDVDTIDICLANVDRREECIGRLSTECTRLPDGDTTVGRMNCLLREYKTWDILLNREYKITRDAFRGADESGDVLNQDLLRTDALLKAQRAWITFRDEECGLQYIRWGKGSFRQVAGADCLMVMTAERVIDLFEMQPF